jgi:hypothetical protein
MGVRLGRPEQLGTLEMLERDRAGSRRSCSPVPVLAGPCKAGDATARHF